MDVKFIYKDKLREDEKKRKNAIIFIIKKPKQNK